MSDLRRRFATTIREARSVLTATGRTADEIVASCRAREDGDPPLSQSQVGAVVGVRQPAVAAWEAGEAFPEVEKLFVLVRLLRIPFGDIAALTDGAAGEPEAVAG